MPEKKKKILVVEDEVTMQRILEMRLTHAGYQVYMANHGQEGLDFLKENKVDLIISDVLMPVMDGFQFYDALKSDKELAELPVMILTAKKMLKDTFLILGADCFLSKPFKPEELLEKIDQLVNFKTGHPLTRMSEDDQRKSKNQIVKNSEIDSSENRILVTGTLIPFVDYMVAELIRIGCKTDVALSAQQVVEKSLAFRPKMILLEVQMETDSAYNIIEKIREATQLETRILLYTYFLENEKTKNAIVTRLFYSQLNKFSKKERPLIHYFGYFKKETFLNRMKKFLEQK